MKGFSFLIFIISINAFAINHPSCNFFEKDSVQLFKISKSNEHKSLVFNIKMKDCLLNSNSRVKVFFKDENGKCSIPSFTYIRNVIGYKNYSDMVNKILNHNELIIPNLKVLTKSNTARSIGLNFFSTHRGCRAESYIKYINSTLSFDHIYQEVDYLTVKNVEILKTTH